MPSVIIATPTNHGVVHADHMSSVVATVMDLSRRGVNVGHAHYDGADVAMQRDDLADQFLRSGASHLFFSDSDVAYGADLVASLLSKSKPLVGAIYPHRNLSLSRLKAAVESGAGWDAAVARSYDYALRPMDGGSRDGNLLEVESIGAGALLISRECFERVAEKCELKSYPSKISTREIRGFFRRIEMPDGSMHWEDWSFCKRWRSVGGQVWAMPYKNIKHIGQFAHFAEYRPGT
jgi:hypothetical protein